MVARFVAQIVSQDQTKPHAAPLLACGSSCVTHCDLWPMESAVFHSLVETFLQIVVVDSHLHRFEESID